MIKITNSELVSVELRKAAMERGQPLFQAAISWNEKGEIYPKKDHISQQWYDDAINLVSKLDQTAALPRSKELPINTDTYEQFDQKTFLYMLGKAVVALAAGKEIDNKFLNMLRNM